MNSMEFQTMMSAVRTALSSVVEPEHLPECKALKAFDEFFDDLCFQNESTILGELGFVPPKVKCKGCCSVKKDVSDF